MGLPMEYVGYIGETVVFQTSGCHQRAKGKSEIFKLYTHV